MNIITERIPVCELLAGLAEEAAELAQAALKLRRVYDGTNPTPMKEEDAIERFYEEIADVQLYLEHISLPQTYINEIMLQKQRRWENRLSVAENA